MRCYYQPEIKTRFSLHCRRVLRQTVLFCFTIDSRGRLRSPDTTLVTIYRLCPWLIPPGFVTVLSNLVNFLLTTEIGAFSCLRDPLIASKSSPTVTVCKNELVSYSVGMLKCCDFAQNLLITHINGPDATHLFIKSIHMGHDTQAYTRQANTHMFIHVHMVL